MARKKLIYVIICTLLLCTTLLNTSGCSNSGSKNSPPEATGSPASTGLPTGNAVDVSESVDDGKSAFNPLFTDEKERKITQVEWAPTKFEKRVKPYSVKSDLSNIVNLNQFGEFTPQQKKMLSKNGFVVMPTNEEQLFYIYEKNEYLKAPSFITTDSVLQVYHIFFDYSLRTLEYEKLMEPLQKLTSNMLAKSVLLYNEIENPEVKNAALKNIIYFAVAQKALEKDLPSSIPDKAKNYIDKEMSLIEDAAGKQKSPLFDFDVDYSQFKPRGHYTRNDEFKKYFKAMMWYGLIPFPLFRDDENKEIDKEKSVQALLITYSLFSDLNGVSDVDLWETIYDPTVFYVGSTDDLNLYHYKSLLINVYGSKPDLENLLSKENIDKLTNEARKLPEPRIKAKWASRDTPVNKQFRFMGQRYIPDSEILQTLVEPFKRPVPKGLDVMGVLGSQRASDLLINTYKENELWDEYEGKFAALKSQFAELSDGTWRSNMYYGWLWTLKGLLNRFGEGYPSFMTNIAWEDKSLSTALGSWAELRHNTILYGKQSGAECGGGEEPPVIKGYVEPNIEVYEKLLWLTKYSRVNLTERNILPDELKSKMESFEELLQFLINCSIKELRNEELTQEEYYQLLVYGGTLEYMTSSFADGGSRWFEITSETDRNMAVIADVHTTSSSYLEVGVGPAAEIFVAVPIAGKIYLTRGAVFSYYEFLSDTRLTDEEWQKMFKEGRQPGSPDWTDSFINGSKEEIPVPAEPYSSGC
ncbi:MAG: DUF3160 domain-containing protein [Bacillota bacterium]